MAIQTSLRSKRWVCKSKRSHKILLWTCNLINLFQSHEIGQKIYSKSKMHLIILCCSRKSFLDLRKWALVIFNLISTINLMIICQSNRWCRSEVKEVSLANSRLRIQLQARIYEIMVTKIRSLTLALSVVTVDLKAPRIMTCNSKNRLISILSRMKTRSRPSKIWTLMKNLKFKWPNLRLKISRQELTRLPQELAIKEYKHHNCLK